MAVNKEAIIKEFGLFPFGNKGWLTSKLIECPNCQKKGKFGIRFSEKGGAVNCFKCDHHENIYKYLVNIGRKDLIQEVEQASFKTSVKTLEELVLERNNLKSNSLKLPEISLPLRTEKINNDEYLENRNFCKQHYNNFDVRISKSKLSLKYNNYIIFSIFQNGVRVALLCRSKRSKKWHKINDIEAKSGKTKLVLRYMNSTSDFAKILGGYDEITNNTKTLILVEGIFDKNGVDYNLNLHDEEETRCCFTFGNKLSEDQVMLIRKKSSIKNVIMMYDNGTVGQQKSSALRLSKYYDVSVCHIPDPDVDPGDMSLEYMNNILKSKKSAFEYYITALNLENG